MCKFCKKCKNCKFVSVGSIGRMKEFTCTKTNTVVEPKSSCSEFVCAVEKPSNSKC